MSPHDARHMSDPEHRPGREGRVSSWIVWRDGCQTVAATSDFALSAAIGVEATRLAREARTRRLGR